MNRRSFFKRSGLAFTGLIFVPKLIRAQSLSSADGLAAFIPSAGVSGTTCDSVNDSSLKAYWRLDESSGTRADTKGTNNLTDSGTTGSASAIIGNGASFTGSTNLSCTSNSNLTLNSGDKFSFACWFKLNSTASVYSIVGKGNEYLLWINSGTLQFIHAGGGGVNGGISASTAISAGVWYWVCITYDPTSQTKTITVNSTNQSWTFNVNSTASASTFVVGNDNTSGGHPFNGIIDEALFSKRVLTLTEQAALYSSGTGCRPTGV